MSHCIVSLKLSGRFENQNETNWDLVCTSDTTSKNNDSASEGKNLEGNYQNSIYGNYQMAKW